MSSAQHRYSCDQALTDVLRQLSTEEAQVELRRQDLSMHYDFEPLKAFNAIDKRRIGRVDAFDIVQFLRDNFVVADLQDARQIVSEYDANQDGSLSFAEFAQLCLPATNNSLRSVAEQRRYGAYFDSTRPLPQDCLNLLTRLLEKEMTLQRHMNEGKRQLAACPDFIKVRTFNDISQGYHSICVPDLIRYLERNGFYPRREDIEAILRRVDHDANHMISYDEFCELTMVVDSLASPSSPEKASPAKKESSAAEETKTETGSPAKKFDVTAEDSFAMRKQEEPADESHAAAGELSPEQKANKEQKHEYIRAKIEKERAEAEAEAERQAEARKKAAEEREAQIEAERAQRQKEYEEREAARIAELEKMKKEREERIAKEEFEREQARAKAKAEYEARIEQEKIEREEREAQYKKEAEERQKLWEEEQARRAEELKARQIEQFMFLRFLKTLINVERRNEGLREVLFCHKTFSVEAAFEHFDKDGNNTVEAAEFEEAFVKADLSTANKFSEKVVELMDCDDDNSVDMREFANAVTPLDAAYRRRQYVGPQSFDEQYLHTTAWVTAFYDLVSAMDQGRRDVDAQAADLMIDGESIFQQIDTYRMGYITGAQFANWVSRECGFSVSDSDLALCVRYLDGGSGHRISRDAFIENICAHPDESQTKKADKSADPKATVKAGGATPADDKAATPKK